MACWQCTYRLSSSTFSMCGVFSDFVDPWERCWFHRQNSDCLLPSALSITVFRCSCWPLLSVIHSVLPDEATRTAFEQQRACTLVLACLISRYSYRSLQRLRRALLVHSSLLRHAITLTKDHIHKLCKCSTEPEMCKVLFCQNHNVVKQTRRANFVYHICGNVFFCYCLLPLQ